MKYGSQIGNKIEIGKPIVFFFLNQKAKKERFFFASEIVGKSAWREIERVKRFGNKKK